MNAVATAPKSTELCPRCQSDRLQVKRLTGIHFAKVFCENCNLTVRFLPKPKPGHYWMPASTVTPAPSTAVIQPSKVAASDVAEPRNPLADPPRHARTPSRNTATASACNHCGQPAYARWGANNRPALDFKAEFALCRECLDPFAKFLAKPGR